jgi:hypothetical protein
MKPFGTFRGTGGCYQAGQVVCREGQQPPLSLKTLKIQTILIETSSKTFNHSKISPHDSTTARGGD